MEDAGAVLDTGRGPPDGPASPRSRTLVAECRSAPGRAGLFDLEDPMKKGSSG